MRGFLVLLLAAAVCASVSCQESTERVMETTTAAPSEPQSENASELIESSLKTADKLYKKFLEDIQQLQMNLASQQQQLEASKQQASALQAQQNSEHINVEQLQQQVSKLSESSVKTEEKHQTQDKDFGQMLQDIKLLQLNQKIQEQEQKRLRDVQEPTVQWVKWAPTDPIPRNAIYAGDNWDNIPMYVGRTNYSNTAIVVKACPTIANAYFSYYSKEIVSTNTEVLTGSGFSWKWGKSGSVPDKAFPVGKHPSGALLYIGRVHHPSDVGSSLTPGTIVTGKDGALYIPFKGIEYRYENYQVLVHD